MPYLSGMTQRQRPTHLLHLSQIKTPEGQPVAYTIYCADDTNLRHQLMFSLQMRADTSLSSCIFHGHAINHALIPAGASFDNVLAYSMELYRKALAQGMHPSQDLPHTDGKNISNTKTFGITAQEADQLTNRVRMNLVAHNIAPERE
jgi:hypothetical protein